MTKHPAAYESIPPPDDPYWRTAPGACPKDRLCADYGCDGTVPAIGIPLTNTYPRLVVQLCVCPHEPGDIEAVHKIGREETAETGEEVIFYNIPTGNELA